MNTEKSGHIQKDFISENMMGPNSLIILEELLENADLKPGMQVLDLGCGKGLTSVFLAKEYGVRVFAVDLWISATENLQRFDSCGVSELVTPIHCDAGKMPFADGYFDAIISVDAYHYFGNKKNFFARKINPLLKKGGLFAVSFPGMKTEIHPDPPKEMLPFWPADAIDKWQTTGWWKPEFEKHLDNFGIWEMNCFEKAWSDWLACKNPYAEEDAVMLKADGGRFMNLIALTGNKH